VTRCWHRRAGAGCCPRSARGLDPSVRSICSQRGRIPHSESPRDARGSRTRAKWLLQQTRLLLQPVALHLVRRLLRLLLTNWYTMRGVRPDGLTSNTSKAER
jgi:hypothetical protein